MKQTEMSVCKSMSVKVKKLHICMKCSVHGKNRRISYLPKKSARKNTITGVTTIQSSIPPSDGRKSHHRNLVTPWLRCYKSNSNPINKDDKKPLAMSSYPQLMAF